MQNDLKKPRLRTPAAADYLGVSASNLEKRRITGDSPRYAKLGKIVTYRIDDLDAWAEARLRFSTSEPNRTGMTTVNHGDPEVANGSSQHEQNNRKSCLRHPYSREI